MLKLLYYNKTHLYKLLITAPQYTISIKVFLTS